MVANALPYPGNGDKTFNLKIGFDLTHGKDGAPALRIRDFEDSSEYHPRADGKVPEPDQKNKEPPLRNGESESGSSSASSSESGPVRKEEKKEDNKEESSGSAESAEKPKEPVSPAVRQGPAMGNDKSSDGSGVSDEETLRSTRGVENFEPEEMGRRRRRKRSPEQIARNRRETQKFIDYYLEKMKLKHKKVNKMPDEPRITSYKPY